MRALRYLTTATALVCWHGGGVILASLLGVRYAPGGFYDRAARSWGRRMLRANGLSVTTEGLDDLPTDRSFVFASNHVSFVDIWALLAVIPHSVRFVAKKELLRVPIFGWAIRAAGHIAIDRTDRSSAVAAYADAALAMRRGLSAIVFAEGTRSRTGQLLPFKKGPFVLAIEAGVPVVPVVVEGTLRVLPKGSIVPRPHPIVLRFGEPIPTEGLGYEGRDALLQRCRDAIEALRGRVDRVGASR